MKASLAERRLPADTSAAMTRHARPELARLAMDMVSQIKRRSDYLPQACPDNPDWMMILELFITTEAGRRLSVSDLCLSSGVPSTTALRRIGVLEQRGVLQRMAHPRDRRISYIRLTDRAHDQVVDYLQSLRIQLHGEEGSFEPSVMPRLVGRH